MKACAILATVVVMITRLVMIMARVGTILAKFAFWAFSEVRLTRVLGSTHSPVSPLEHPTAVCLAFPA
jgi:hypothetical protein